MRPVFLGGRFYSDVEALAQSVGFQEDAVYHSQLLMYSGVMVDEGFLIVITTAVGIVGFIILLGSVALIYNSFSISLAERNRYLGMLASVGATSRQKGRSVLFEAAVIGAVSIPIGLLSGVAGIGVTFLFVNPLMTSLFDTQEQLKLVVSLPALLAATFFSIVILLISAAVPAWRASRISPIDAIRQAGEVAPEKRHIRVSWITRRLFGFEGALALKNVKRNHKRYLATLFSLIISVVLFLAASGFSYYFGNSFRMTQAGVSYDVHLSVTSETREALEDVLVQARRLPDAESSITAQYQFMDLELSQEQFQDLPKAEDNPVQLCILGMDEDSFSAYAGAAGVPLSEEGDAGILINDITLKDGTTFSHLRLTHLKQGDRLSGWIPIYDSSTAEETERIEASFSITGITGAGSAYSSPLSGVPDHALSGCTNLSAGGDSRALRRVQRRALLYRFECGQPGGGSAGNCQAGAGEQSVCEQCQGRSGPVPSAIHLLFHLLLRLRSTYQPYQRGQHL